MFPISSSLTRRLASLRRIARDSLLRLPRYHQGVPTSCRPSSPTHFSFVWRYHALLPVMRKRGVAVCRLLVGTAPVPQSSSFARAHGDEAGSPRFLGSPFANMLCSSTPADRMRPATATHPILPSVQLTTSAPRSVTFRGSITQPARSLSTLRGSDCSDHTTQDSLPAGGQPWRGRTSTCWAAFEGFSL
jgi:hypothetical protein